MAKHEKSDLPKPDHNLRRVVVIELLVIYGLTGALILLNWW